MWELAFTKKALVISSGALAGQGTHEELLGQNELYAKLWNIQQESLGWSV